MNALAVAPIVRLPFARDVYDYQCDRELAVGTVVTVALRAAKVRGVVIGLGQHSRKRRALLPITNVEQQITVPSATLEFFRWMREQYGVGYGVLLGSYFSFLASGSVSGRATIHSPKNGSAQTAVDWRQAHVITDIVTAIRAERDAHPNAQLLVLAPNTVLLESIASLCRQLSLAVVHSALPRSALVEVGQRVARGEPILVLATRLGLFLPWTKLAGILLTHENHEDHSAHESAPRYHTRDAAAALARFWGGDFSMLGATPSLSAWHECGAAKNAIGSGLNFPGLPMIDMRERPFEERFVSHECFEMLRETLQQQKSVLLIHERRGVTTTLVCPTCGWLARCPKCQAPLLTGVRFLRCSLCSEQHPLSLSCGQCGGRALAHKPAGIERLKPQLEAELQKEFPDNPPAVAIFSKDSPLQTSRGQCPIVLLATSYAFDRMEVLAERLRPLGAAAILSLDGVLVAGAFDSAETVFARLTQFGAATASLGIAAMVQTRFPEHHAFRAFPQKDPSVFYEKEIAERARFGFPPVFSRLSIEERKPIPTLKRHLARFASGMDVVATKTYVVVRCPVAERHRLIEIQSALLDRFPGKLKLTQI